MTRWSQQELLTQAGNLKRTLDERVEQIRTLRSVLVNEAAEKTRLEEELGRRYREIETLKNKCHECEQETDYQVEESQNLRTTIVDLQDEKSNLQNRIRHLEREVEDTRRRHSGY